MPSTTEKQREKVNQRKLAIRALLTSLGCVDCGIKDWRVLEWDHVKGAKVSGVMAMVKSHAPWPRILEEIAKCEPRCANCHRIKTIERI